jgi:Na+/melibiose symporter-like transporter
LNVGISIFVIVGMLVVASSLAADIIDEQEIENGKRQEGTVFAAGAFVAKATTGAGALLGGIVIDLTGIKSGSMPGTVDASILQSLGWFTLVMTAGLALVACLFYSRLTLGRIEHGDIRRQLALSKSLTE